MKRIAIALSMLAFLSAPAAFAATGSSVHGEYANFCAWGLINGKQVMTDCSINWKDGSTGKIYCFSSEQAKTQWSTNTASNITKANAAFASKGTSSNGASASSSSNHQHM